MFILQTTIFYFLQRWLVPVVTTNSFLINSGAVSKNLNDYNSFTIPFSFSWTTLNTQGWILLFGSHPDCDV